jgi:DNA adenine methylase
VHVPLSQISLFGKEKPLKPGLSPLVKWVGGKRKLAERIGKYLPAEIEGSYYEGFVGGAGLLCHLQTQGRVKGPVVLADFNYDLINLYRTVKQALPAHLRSLSLYEKVYNSSPRKAEELFHRVRDEWNCGIRTPDRFVFLKKTCFNGLWRENRHGVFNVGWGKYPTFSVPEEEHRQWHHFLNDHNALLVAGDTLKWDMPLPKAGDVVYLDPPYVDTFSAYTAEGFSMADQSRLLTMACEWDAAGVCVAMSNSMMAVPLVGKLWPAARVVELDVNYAVNCDGAGRAKQKEILVVSKRGER